MSDGLRFEYEQLAREEAALRRRFMVAIFDDDSEVVERTRVEIKDLESRRVEARARIRSAFDVVV